ncbi:LysR family transcriptional regulator [Actinospica sp. MGRD01-02]|uniref:LysR family transcriptional regulator n=1 Tax=Actinospica acidithermotolerans TaxID=2828514 RepID=A0A941EE23_9ACTN|nr:LysR family transcriptional regulator [Actinospica acidithermotolerans]MBR7828723.1 LysR family transcriptional regulator [Actinospica acidithermotolerans]
MQARHLRAFLAVLDCGGIAAAAQQLGFAQSSVSDQLRGLEQELGVPVLHRTSTGTVPTPAGERLAPLAREWLELDERLRREVVGARPRVRIGVVESLATEWMPDLLTAFELGAAGPGQGAEPWLVVGMRDQIAEDLAAGRLDVAFVFDNGNPTALPHATIGQDQVVLVAAPDHPLARAGRPLTRDELMEAEFMVADHGCTSQYLLDQYGRDIGPFTRIGMLTGSTAMLRRIVANGRGITMVPRLVVARELADGDLVELELAPECSLRLARVGIEARWQARLGTVSEPLHALVRLARRHAPFPVADASNVTDISVTPA